MVGLDATVQGADAYIKAFNEAYPNIHVTFKEITIAGYDAAMQALASSVGPDVFDIAPGGGIGSIAELAPDTTKTSRPSPRRWGLTGSQRAGRPGQADHLERETRALPIG